ncbi:hypothetical protein [Antarctobacter jejuensis]|uniref:hypothetical protein n=1 Tax=Antarctobacter jejuensis TaxID=1439938 RepID=UPI003FD4F107
MIPEAYEFKRLASEFRRTSIYGFLFEGIEEAPVYHFADQAAFDSDEVDALGPLIMDKPLLLPHPAVVFEVKDRDPIRSSLLVYARQFDDRVEAGFVFRDGKRRKWTDCLVHAVFAEPGVAEVTAHPKLSTDEANVYHAVATGIVWRALSILAHAGEARDRKVMPAQRAGYAKAGVRGWTWHQVTIDLERARAKQPPAGGTHASPRWHIRRGHWRQLADGRRVFVRECQVGDPAQGGVVKDYMVKGRAA